MIAKQAEQDLAVDERLVEIDKRRLQVLEALEQMNAEAQKGLSAEQSRAELRVFVYRLAFTLPLLLLAIYLFAQHRRKPYWPFVWGFIFFVGFAFFVELVPYLPSYGGYVRFGVGALMTLVAGSYAIRAFRGYLDRQKALEQTPSTERANALDYDLTMASLAKSACPSCERPVQLQSDNFCPHCGLTLHEACSNCGTRQIGFARFCLTCGAKDSGESYAKQFAETKNPA